MDYANLRMKGIPYVSLKKETKRNNVLYTLSTSKSDSVGTYVCGRSGLEKPSAGYGVYNPCHANLHVIFQSEKGSFTIWNRWDSLNKLKDSDSDLGKKMLFEFYLGEDSPWKAVLPYTRVLDIEGDLWLEFSGDDNGEWSPGFKRLVTNLCIALRAPFEGNYTSSHVQINYGISNIVRLMETFDVSYREALYFNRIFDWGTENKDKSLRIHTPKAVNNGGFVHHFLHGRASKWLSRYTPKLSEFKDYAARGNDQRIWGESLSIIREIVSSDKRPLLQGAFARYDMPHLIEKKDETNEDYLKFILKVIREETSKPKKKAA